MPRPNPPLPIDLALLVRSLQRADPATCPAPDPNRDPSHDPHRWPPGSFGADPTALALADPSARDHRRRDFATVDPLALSRLPGTGAAATASPAALEARLARLLRLNRAVTFATGSAALRGTLGAILRPGDQIILDAGCDPAMFETVLPSAATALRSPAGSVAAVERRLHRLARQRSRGRLWVAVPALSARASVMADLAELTALCRHHGAGLIVDVSQDLGAMAPDGGGVMEVLGCQGQADVVLGNLARLTGSAGGFAAFRQPGALAALPWPVTPAPDPARILAALDLVASAEGRRRRQRLHATGLRLRNHLMSHGVPVLGHPSPIVPVALPPARAPAAAALLAAAGFRAPLLQAPLVAGHAPRWCLELSSDHGPADIDDLADLIRDILCPRQPAA